MGFKDLKAFNLALLGKQCWRQITKEHSLFHKIFKSRYFKYGSFMNAELGNNPSWAWRSLLEGRKVLEKGLKWKVGDGESISIQADPWLFNQYPYYLPPNGCHNRNLILVKQLIRDDGCWNEDMIRDQFLPEIADSILLKQPTGEKDELLWSMNKNGVYSVVSGYDVAFSFFHPPTESLPFFFADKKSWSAVWDLKAPTKIKTLVWKLMHEGVPVRKKLQLRIPNIDASCPWCLSEEESVIHCMVTCPHSGLVWNQMNIPTWLRSSSNFYHWWSSMVNYWKNDPLKGDKFSLLAFILWRIWTARNLKIFEGKDTAPQVIYSTALSLKEEFKIHGLSISSLP